MPRGSQEAIDELAAAEQDFGNDLQAADDAADAARTAALQDKSREDAQAARVDALVNSKLEEAAVLADAVDTRLGASIRALKLVDRP